LTVFTPEKKNNSEIRGDIPCLTFFPSSARYTNRLTIRDTRPNSDISARAPSDLRPGLDTSRCHSRSTGKTEKASLCHPALHLFLSDVPSGHDVCRRLSHLLRVPHLRPHAVLSVSRRLFLCDAAGAVEAHDHDTCESQGIRPFPVETRFYFFRTGTTRGRGSTA
jgi:hypothetical protein